MLRHVVPFTNFYNQALLHFLFLMFRIAPLLPISSIFSTLVKSLQKYGENVEKSGLKWRITWLWLQLTNGNTHLKGIAAAEAAAAAAIGL